MQSINQKDILTGKIQAINGFKWPDGRLRWEKKDILTGGVLDIEIKNSITNRNIIVSLSLPRS